MNTSGARRFLKFSRTLNQILKRISLTSKEEKIIQELIEELESQAEYFKVGITIN